MWCRRACQSSCNTYNNNLKEKRKNIEYNNMFPNFKLPGVQWCEVLLEASGLKLKVPHNPEKNRVQLLLHSFSLTWSLREKTPHIPCRNHDAWMASSSSSQSWGNSAGERTRLNKVKERRRRDREKSTKAKSDSQHQQQQKYDVMPKKIKGEEGKKGENVWCSHDVSFVAPAALQKLARRCCSWGGGVEGGKRKKAEEEQQEQATNSSCCHCCSPKLWSPNPNSTTTSLLLLLLLLHHHFSTYQLSLLQSESCVHKFFNCTQHFFFGLKKKKKKNGRRRRWRRGDHQLPRLWRIPFISPTSSQLPPTIYNTATENKINIIKIPQSKKLQFFKRKFLTFMCLFSSRRRRQKQPNAPTIAPIPRRKSTERKRQRRQLGKTKKLAPRAKGAYGAREGEEREEGGRGQRRVSFKIKGMWIWSYLPMGRARSIFLKAFGFWIFWFFGVPRRALHVHEDSIRYYSRC